jgi:hypothetical protein
MKRKKANTMHIEVAVEDLTVSEVLVDFEVVNDELISEILILAILWVVFLVVDLADDEEEKLLKVERIYK